MMNEYFYGVAERASQAASQYGLTIDSRWIYCQWCHETDYFTSELQASNHNLGGLTQYSPNNPPQPDGNMYYMNFDTFEDYADYFGMYLSFYKVDGIAEATTLEEYIVALKRGGYFGDTLENYLTRTKEIFAETFGNEADEY